MVSAGSDVVAFVFHAQAQPVLSQVTEPQHLCKLSAYLGRYEDRQRPSINNGFSTDVRYLGT